MQLIMRSTSMEHHCSSQNLHKEYPLVLLHFYPDFYMKWEITSLRLNRFQKVVYDHYQRHGRMLPWRKTRNPYHIVVSEIMLQQTQADRVVPKYLEFIKAFPSFDSLARAPLSRVLKEWQGLGYNRRAIALTKVAGRVITECDGMLPEDPQILKTFPGIGPTTAASIAAFAFNKPTLFVETNIRTVFIHSFFPDAKEVTDKEILPLVEKTLDWKNPRKWYNALMDYGMTLKKSHHNPSRNSVHYRKQSPFKGSNRQLRGAILRELTKKDSASVNQLAKALHIGEEKIKANLDQLQREGFIKTKKGVARLA